MTQATIRLPRAVAKMGQRADELLTAPPQVDAPAPDVIEAPKAPVDTPPATPAPSEPSAKGAEYWEHRFKTVEGMYAADKARAAKELEVLTKELADTRSKLTKVEQSVPREFDLRKYLSEGEIEAYGSENLQTLLKAAVQAAQEDVDERVNARVKHLEEQVHKQAEVVSNREVDMFWDAFERAVPDWEEINNDKAFLAWLKEEDPVTGISRQAVLDDAQRKLDSKRVTLIFQAYIKLKAAAESARNTSLNKKIVPDGLPSGGHMDTTEGDVEWVTRAEISQFHTDVALGRYKKRPDAMERMEKRINAAIRADRVK